jgi:hypothetical protein
MKALCLLFLLFMITLRVVGNVNSVVLPEEDAETPETYQMVWDTEAGVRYEAQYSTDLSTWLAIDGYPAEAVSSVDAVSFGSEAGSMFLRVLQLDEQAPVIVARAPEDGAFAVKRFSSVSVSLSDLTGIDPSTISLKVGSLGTYSVADSQLTFSDGILSFGTDGSMALGEYGETVSVSLIVSDTLGNAMTYAWSFDTELEPHIAENLFVFGSSQAQKLGQRIGPSPTAFLSKRYSGNQRLQASAAASPWEIRSVEDDRILLAYTGAAPPSIPTGTFLSNLTPTSKDEIFYRRALSVSDDSANKLLTIFTEEVNLEEIIQQGSLQLSRANRHSVHLRLYIINVSWHDPWDGKTV